MEKADEAVQVLLIDDSDLDRERIRRQLERKCEGNYELAEGISGQECLDMLKSKHFDCLLLDYRLADMTGIEVLEAIRNHNLKDAAVIVMTGAGDYEIDRHFQMLGAYDYLVKDQITPPTLERSIRYAVKLKAQLDALANANRVKDDFMAAMSHEMRTPLNALINYSDFLKKGVYGEVSEKQNHIVDRLHRAGLHLSTIVESVLTTMSFQRDALKLDLEEVKLSEEMRFAVELLTESAVKKGVDLIPQIPEGLHCRGDASRIRQIILNVVGNAIKFTETGSVTVSAQYSDGEIYITVKDTGIGISEEKLASVFEPFVQAEGCISRRYGGVGLGLTISKKLTEMHGGRILLESLEGLRNNGNDLFARRFDSG